MYLTIKDITKLKRLCRYLDTLLSQNTHLQRYYYNIQIKSVIKVLDDTGNINKYHKSNINTFIRILNSQVYPTCKKNKSFNQHLSKMHCHNECKHSSNIIYFIGEVIRNKNEYFLEIERTFNSTKLSIMSQLNNYYHNKNNIAIIETQKKINTKFMRHINHSFVHYLLQHSFEIVDFYWYPSNHRNKFQYISVSSILNKSVYNNPFHINEHFFNQILSDFRLSWLMNFILKQYRNHYLITGTGVISRVIEQFKSLKTPVIKLFAYGITIEQHLECISNFIHDLYLYGIKFKTQMGTKYIRFVQIFTQPNNFINFRFTIKFVYTKSPTILSVLNKFGLSIEQFGITFNGNVYYTKAWLFTCLTRIGYYFNITFRDTYADHHNLFHYIDNNLTTWLIPNSIFNQKFNTDSMVHTLFTVNFLNRYIKSERKHNHTHQRNKIFSEKVISKTNQFNQNWDSDCLLCKFIHKLLKIYTNNDTDTIIDKQVILNDMISTLQKYYLSFRQNCICLLSENNN